MEGTRQHHTCSRIMGTPPCNYVGSPKTRAHQNTANHEAQKRHGRDNRLLVWQLAPSDEIELDQTLPVDGDLAVQKLPWLLHAIPVNALNFCSFAMCYDGMPHPSMSSRALRSADITKPILFAVPNTMDSGGVSSILSESNSKHANVP